MTDLVRRFRGLGVALVVLAISAGAAFAAAPRFTPASETSFETTETSETTEKATFGAGCFRGVEGDFRNVPGRQGRGGRLHGGAI